MGESAREPESLQQLLHVDELVAKDTPLQRRLDILAAIRDRFDQLAASQPSQSHAVVVPALCEVSSRVAERAFGHFKHLSDTANLQQLLLVVPAAAEPTVGRLRATTMEVLGRVAVSANECFFARSRFFLQILNLCALAGDRSASSAGASTHVNMPLCPHPRFRGQWNGVATCTF